MEQANLDYRNAKDTTVFLQGSGMYGGGTYQQVSKAENQASAKARFDKETENLKQVLIKRNKDLEPYLKIVQKTMSLEASLERPSSTPTQKGAYSTKSSGTTSAKSLDTSKIEDSPELARERMIADARMLMDKELTDAKIEEENKRVQAVVEATSIVTGKQIGRAHV